MADDIKSATVDVPEIAAGLGVARNTVYEAIARNELPGIIRIGKRVLMSRKVYDRMLAGELPSVPREQEPAA